MVDRVEMLVSLQTVLVQPGSVLLMELIIIIALKSFRVRMVPDQPRSAFRCHVTNAPARNAIPGIIVTPDTEDLWPQNGLCLEEVPIMFCGPIETSAAVR